MPEIIAGKYEVQEVIGRGGMGTVYKALQRNLDRVVAIKMLSEELAADPEFRARFQQEATIIARLNHPNIVAVHDIEPHNHTFCIIMEYLEGETLQAKIDRDVALPEKEALFITAQVARALHYAHEHGIVHRDIKPDNIHISPQGVAKVMDFGIARFLQSKLKTQTGISMGTPKFMSPEQVTGKNVDGQTDLYSLGICLYVSLTGRVPFDGENAIAIATRHLYEPPELPSSINQGITPAAEKIVMRALEKAKADRYRDGNEMAAAIESVLSTRTPLRIGEEGREIYAGATQKMASVPQKAAAAVAVARGATPASLTPASDTAVAVTTPTGLHRLTDAAAREHEIARQTVRASTISTTDIPRLEEEDFAGADLEDEENENPDSRLSRAARRFWPLAVALLLIAAAVAYLLLGGRGTQLPVALPGVSVGESQSSQESRLRSLEQNGRVAEALKGWAKFQDTYGSSDAAREEIARLKAKLPLTETRQLALRRQDKGLAFSKPEQARHALTCAYLEAARELKDPEVPSKVGQITLDLARQQLGAAAARPADARAALQRAQTKETQGKHAEAEKDLLDAVSADPNNYTVWLRLGDYYLGRDYWDDARVAYGRAVKLAPEKAQEEVRASLRKLEQRAGQAGSTQTA